MTAEEVVVAVLSMSLQFPLSIEEARDPVMKQSLGSGFAASLGLEPEKVKVEQIGGMAVRRLANGVDIVFEVESASTQPAQVQMLETDMIAAATEGSLVANIQKIASENGVLTPALFSMPRVLDAPAVFEGTKTKLVYKPQRVTVAPTAAPTSWMDHPHATPLPTFVPTYMPTVEPTAAPSE
jgi:hypothetical protein